MGRPMKKNADYFPHDANMRNDRRVKALRKKFPLQGYAVYNFLLEVLTACDNFLLHLSEEEQELLAADFGISTIKLKEIVDYSVKLGLLDIENDVLFSNELITGLQPLIEKRKREAYRIQEKRMSEQNSSSKPIVAPTTTQGNKCCSNNIEKLEFPLSEKNKEKKSKVNNSRECLKTHTLENIKKIEEQNGFLFECLKYDDEHTFFFLQMVEKEMWIEQVGMNHHLDKKDVYRYLDLFVIDTRAGSVQHTDLNDCKRHFNAWLGQRLSGEKNKKIKNNGSNGNTIDRRRPAEILPGLKKSDFEGTF